MTKKKRRLNGRFIALVCAVLLLTISIYKVPHFINTNKLLDLGYSQEAIEAIYDLGLRKTILENEYYSDYLNKEIVKDSFNQKYLRLYTMCDYLDDSYFELYESLKAKKGYSDSELETLFTSLKDYDLKPLYVFDKLQDEETINEYIEDCLNNENSSTSFTVSGDYLHPYENVIEVSEPYSIEAYVSTKSTIGEYEPTKRVEINSLHAVPGIELESRALQAYEEMCNAIRNEDLNMAIYAYQGYVSYETQKQAHIDDDSQTEAGYCDSQTGLAVYILASENPKASAFKDCKVYSWLLQHGHEYGFIQRFPEGKEDLTGHSAVYNYFRYVGVDLATKIYESGLSFDEYYFQYIK